MGKVSLTATPARGRHWLRVAELLVLVMVMASGGSGCTGDERVRPVPAISTDAPGSTTPTFEGDLVGSDLVGQNILAVNSPDGKWTAYNRLLAQHDNKYSLFLEGPDGFKQQLATGSPWPESFSPDSALLLYVDYAQLTPTRSANSLFVVYLPTGQIEQVTNVDPVLSGLTNDDYAHAYVATPLAGVTWSGHTITYITRASASTYEKVTLDVDSKTLTRAPSGAP